ncbi:MAG: 1-deoxy-D-xylulose-5-phosphate reductoisomerase [Pseudomonadota bacterium]
MSYTVDYISSMPSRQWAESTPRSIVVLGSTGSIGTSALAVMATKPHFFHVVGLACARNIEKLVPQALAWRPAHLGVLDDDSAHKLQALLPSDYQPTIHIGSEGYATMAALPEASTVLSAQVGSAGLRATHAAARHGKVICLANKESLVLAGDLIRQECAKSGAVILPVDSEHNAIFQALQGRDFGSPQEIHRILLTASGGPFRGYSRERLESVTLAQALKHPNWSMGAKITIDSATLMNKGLEIIEACHLYGVPMDAVEVLVHPQSIVHSLVDYVDGSQIAQLGTPDMRTAIAYCMAWPHRIDSGVPRLDLVKAASLTFEAPDLCSFPCLELARESYRQGKGLSVVLNAANEVAVAHFLQDKIHFLDIPRTIEKALNAHDGTKPHSIEDIEALDAITRQRVTQSLNS